MPIDPATALGSEWTVGAAGGPEWSLPGGGVQPAAEPGGDTGFGGMLAEQVGALTHTQNQAAEASRALATGTATDMTEVVMTLERAKLSMQLAAQLRGKGTEAFQEIYRTQV